MKDERIVSKKEGKTDFSRRLEQFDGLTSLTMTPTLIFRQIYATVGGGDDFIRDVHVLRVPIVIALSHLHLIIIIIETFVTRLLQLKNEHKRYICYIKIYKNR